MAGLEPGLRGRGSGAAVVWGVLRDILSSLGGFACIGRIVHIPGAEAPFLQTAGHETRAEALAGRLETNAVAMTCSHRQR